MNASRPAGMSMDEFMGHSNRSTKKKYLKNWKKESPYAITVWLSCLSSIVALWRHGFPRIELVEDKQTKQKTKEVWTYRLVCYEDEDVIKHAGWRDRVTGEREKPPVLCPHCKMIEDVYQRVLRGELGWADPIFRFQADDPRKTRVIHAAGLWNGFGAKELTDAQKAMMQNCRPENGGPIYQKDAWQQNSLAKLEYAFAVVDNDDVAGGVQVAIEPNLLGDKLKTAIAERAKALKLAGKDPSFADPTIHPYAFRWEYNPAKDIEFGKKYSTFILGDMRPTPAIEKLLRETDPPDMTTLAEKFNLKTHRALLERHAVAKLPFDDYFKAAFAWEEARKNGAPAEAPREPVAAGASYDRAMEAAEGRAPEVGGTRVPEQVPATPTMGDGGVELVACDDCGKAIKMTDPRCPHCGKQYEVDAAPAAAPPPAPMPTRSQAAQSKLGPVAPPQEESPGGGGGWPGDPGDDIPFIRNGIATGEVSESWWE